MKPFYADGEKSVIDPQRRAKYVQASRGLNRYLRVVLGQADAFAATHDENARSCAISLLGAWAAADAMNGRHTSQGQHNRAWALGSLCLAYIKLGGKERSSNDGAIGAWFSRLADGVVAHQTSRRNEHGADAETNLYYWAGMSVGCVGVVLDRADYWRFGAEAFERATANIGPDGVLAIESRRGRRAALYHDFAAQPLVLLARLGRYGGDDIYGRDGEALDRLVGLVKRLLADPQILARSAGVEQEALPRARWMGLYERLRGAEAYYAAPEDEERDQDSRLGGRVAALDKALQGSSSTAKSSSP
ncbi:alginate lyase family protein [Hansschlegelia zhihuaiae]|uniref:Alginate lyase domain-containing protein n=1 Tax=Hansschlegelia zhihuaiae TaxID=405005 RepID=A0A4Q0MLA4_9HYPH|nr:alginate lyase family protein [Hansschlegelia zhihuaiae]RXF74458.1 hypothetical protein EK403_06530 [Hansschlegelia zhihuaiae]